MKTRAMKLKGRKHNENDEKRMEVKETYKDI